MVITPQSPLGQQLMGKQAPALDYKFQWFTNELSDRVGEVRQAGEDSTRWRVESMNHSSPSSLPGVEEDRTEHQAFDPPAADFNALLAIEHVARPQEL